jgi:hypothetical protein
LLVGKGSADNAAGADRVINADDQASAIVFKPAGVAVSIHFAGAAVNLSPHSAALRWQGAAIQ